MARMRPRDVEDLTAASLKLQEVTNVIQAWKSPAAAPTISMLRDVNDVVTRVRDRGLTKMQRVLGKIGDQLDQEARAKAGAANEE